MGSEGPPTVTVHVTGFKKFHGVSENPTETVVTNLKEFMKKRGYPKGLILGSCSILETAGQGAVAPLYQMLQSSLSKNDSESSNLGRLIWKHYAMDNEPSYGVYERPGEPKSRTSVVQASRSESFVHFGVNSGATRFAIENQAVNEATFRCPDEMGWKPQKVPIVPADGGISRRRETSLPVQEITKTLAKMGYDVMASDDAGRFVCNYVYYHSLRFAEQNGIASLFVHVPLFVAIDEETQMQFAASLLEVLASVY